MNTRLAEMLMTYGDDFVPYLKLMARIITESDQTVRPLKDSGRLGVVSSEFDKEWLDSAQLSGWLKHEDYSTIYLGDLVEGGFEWYTMPVVKTRSSSKHGIFEIKKNEAHDLIDCIVAALNESPVDLICGPQYNLSYLRLAHKILATQPLDEAQETIKFAANHWDTSGLRLPKKDNLGAIMSKSVWPTLIKLKERGIVSTCITDRYTGPGFED